METTPRKHLKEGHLLRKPMFGRSEVQVSIVLWARVYRGISIEYPHFARPQCLFTGDPKEYFCPWDQGRGGDQTEIVKPSDILQAGWHLHTTDHRRAPTSRTRPQPPAGQMAGQRLIHCPRPNPWFYLDLSSTPSNTRLLGCLTVRVSLYLFPQSTAWDFQPETTLFLFWPCWPEQETA